MKCLYNGKILLNNEVLEGKALLFDEKILDIIDESLLNSYDVEKIDCKGNYISPGLIDIHTHGYLGDDASDGNKDGLLNISRGIAKNGVTSYLPTTMTLDIDSLENAFNVIKEVKEEGTGGAQILGLHMEGPYLSSKRKGCHDETLLISPDYEFVNKYKDIIKIITVAPELEGATSFINKIKQNTDITLSMGHTNATFDQAITGFNHGITHVTHTFNAMSPLHHRDPGAVGAALTSDVTCELIADTIHVSKYLFKFMLKAKGLDKLVLITDCMRAGGLKEGEYSLGGLKVIVKNNKPVLEDGTIAGSVLKLNKGLFNMYQNTNYKIAQLIDLATINPAKVIGVQDRKGTLDIGKDADIIVFNDDIDIKYTITKGDIVYENKN